MVPPALRVATTILALTSPGTSLRSETRGLGSVFGYAVRKVGADGETPVRLIATAVAPLGTPANPLTCTVRVPPVPRLSPLHWALLPLSTEGLVDLVSQMRIGAGSALYREPLPPAAV